VGAGRRRQAGANACTGAGAGGPEQAGRGSGGSIHAVFFAAAPDPHAPNTPPQTTKRPPPSHHSSSLRTTLVSSARRCFHLVRPVRPKLRTFCFGGGGNGAGSLKKGAGKRGRAKGSGRLEKGVVTERGIPKGKAPARPARLHDRRQRRLVHPPKAQSPQNKPKQAPARPARLHDRRQRGLVHAPVLPRGRRVVARKDGVPPDRAARVVGGLLEEGALVPVPGGMGGFLLD
jgi:hypothetical protein